MSRVTVQELVSEIENAEAELRHAARWVQEGANCDLILSALGEARRLIRAVEERVHEADEA